MLTIQARDLSSDSHDPRRSRAWWYTHITPAVREQRKIREGLDGKPVEITGKLQFQ